MISYFLEESSFFVCYWKFGNKEVSIYFICCFIKDGGLDVRLVSIIMCYLLREVQYGNYYVKVIVRNVLVYFI